MSKSNADIDGLKPKVRDVVRRFQELFPDFDVVSGVRSPSYNAGVRGAKASRHMHADAFDFNPQSGVSDERKADAIKWLRNEGAQGFGTYDKTGRSFHADWRGSGPAAWGPNRSHTSLNQTPAWFAEAMTDHRGGGRPDQSYATIPPGSIPTAKPTAAPRPVDYATLGYTSLPPQVSTPQVSSIQAPPARPIGALPLSPTPSPSPQGVLPGMPPGLVQRVASTIGGMDPATTSSTTPAPQAEAPSLWQRLTSAYQTATNPIAPGEQGLIGRPGTQRSVLPAIFDYIPGKLDPFQDRPPNAPPAPLPQTQVPTPQPQVQTQPPADNPLIVRGIRPQVSQAQPQVPQAQSWPAPPQRPTDLFPQAEAENPLIIRNIRPTSQMPEMSVPMPPRRPPNDQLFALPERPMGALPAPPTQNSGQTMWGANYHGPNSSLINVLQGSTPTYEAGLQNNQSLGNWLGSLFR